MSFFKRIYGVIVSPRKTLAEISENASVWQGVLALVVPALISTLLVFNSNTFIDSLGAGASPYAINQMKSFIPMFISFGVFSAMFITPVFHFISTAVCHLLAGFFDHDGRGKGLFNSLAFANIPSIISSIAYIIFMNINLSVISIIFSIGIWIWTIVLKIFAIKENYKMGGGKATLIYFIPILTVIVIVGVMIILSILTMIPFFNNMVDTIGMPI